MNYKDYEPYITGETMMGPSSVRILEELFGRYPLRLGRENCILDLGCGTGLTSLVIARETGAMVYANDLHFEPKQFDALVSIDSYHYFAGYEGFFQNKILPYMKDEGVVLIGIPGLKDEYTGRSEELLSDWLGDDAYMFKAPGLWKELIGGHERIESVITWEMECFEQAWMDWFASEHEYALGDKQYYDTIIKPYTCFVGICVKLK